MPSFNLSSGVQMPALGLGTWNGDDQDIYNAVKYALAQGYRHIDCAPIYGNESAIGKALKENFSSNTIKREELFITSKLWNSFHLKKDVLPAIKKILLDLQCDYLDLFLIHWPVAFGPKVGLAMAEGKDYLPLVKAPLIETWAAMEELVKMGLTKSIGVSNFSKKQMSEILPHAIFPIAVNQVECHPFLSQENLLEFCQKNNIHLTAYSPLGSSGRPAASRHKDEPSILESEIILKIARTHHATAAQVALAWQLARGVSVIPKSTHPNRITENFDSLLLKLNQEDIQQINSLNTNYRYIDASFWTANGSPYKLTDFWDGF